MVRVNKVEIVSCYQLKVCFHNPEGLNKFTDFLFSKKIKGLGFESSKKNTDNISFFTEDEIKFIKEYFEKNTDGKIV